ncbi:hypothetical protein CHS0354_022678 [Potamilus streckersoni]|uniref:Uncharacterized protein n=1 Tax=Potamilus streckersoni TaxID=2493646 RepID=A0AAE0VQS9_9BIVA|nr:hypothetical protein CHS0354_022678 [Potamilus streckersoni]
MSGSSVRLECLLHSLKEVQHEKTCLEHKLNEKRSKRQELESSVQGVNTKLMQVKDVHCKMLETMKVAQHKVEETQSQADSLDEANQSKRKSLKDLNNKIEAEKQKQAEEVSKFEEELSAITDQLRQAKKYYTDHNLERHIWDTVERQHGIETQDEGFEAEIEHLSHLVADLMKERKQCWNEDLPLEVRKQICYLFQQENEALHSYLRILTAEMEESKVMLNQLQESQE